MNFEIGQVVEHNSLGIGQITRIPANNCIIGVLFEGDTIDKYVDPRKLRATNADGVVVNGEHYDKQKAAAKISAETKILNLTPAKLPELFVAYLNAHRSGVEIRIHYPAHSAEWVSRKFALENISLPVDIRPLQSGKRGGATVQRGLAGEMWFPEGNGAEAALHALAIDYPQVGYTRDQRGGVTKYHISNLNVVFGTLKAGFPITVYAKIPTVDIASVGGALACV